MSRLSRRRNNESFAVRQSLQERVGAYSDFADATAEQRATALVIESGDLLLHLLIESATSEHRVGSGRKQRKRDETLLTDALQDVRRVQQSWAFLAHGIAQWTRGAPIAAEAHDDVPVHEAALRLLRAHYPVSEDEQELLRIAPKAPELGFPSEEHVVTSGAFDALLGERAETLALFDDPEPWTDGQILQVAFERGSERYVEVLLEGVIHANEVES